MSSTSSSERYGASSRAGGLAKVQYPQRSRHSIVSGMNTLGENVIRLPCPSSRRRPASSTSSATGTSTSPRASAALSMSTSLSPSPSQAPAMRQRSAKPPLPRSLGGARAGPDRLAVRSLVHEPDHACGRHARGREVVAGLDPLQRFALPLVRHREHSEAGLGQGPERQ